MILQGATSTAIGSDAFKSVITAIQVVEVLAYTAGICVALAFMWWGVRKATRALMAAFKKGRVSV